MNSSKETTDAKLRNIIMIFEVAYSRNSLNREMCARVFNRLNETLNSNDGTASEVAVSKSKEILVFLVEHGLVTQSSKMSKAS